MSTIVTERNHQRRHHAGFWLSGFAFLAVIAFATLPTALYPLLAQRDGLSPLMVTVVFSAYAVGVMLALYLVGHLSDTLGRKNLTGAAILLEVIASVVFVASENTVGLIVARLVTGLGVGMITATATAHLSELRAASHPEEGGATASLVSTVITTAGLALGPLAGGALAHLSDSPLRTPFEVFTVILLVAGLGFAFAPETVERPQTRAPYRPQRVALPAHQREMFASAALAAAASFAVLGFFTALTGNVLANLLDVHSPLTSGWMVFGVIGSSAASQLLMNGSSARLQRRVAVATSTLGLLGITMLALQPSGWLLLTSGVLAGAGAGLVFKSAIAAVAMSTPPQQRGEVLSALFLIANLGLIVPVVLSGVALSFWSLRVVLVCFSLAVLSCVLISSWFFAQHSTPATPPRQA